MTATTQTTFQQAADAYTELLAGRTDKAITLSPIAVVLLRGGSLHLALSQGGMVDLNNAVQLTEDQWSCHTLVRQQQSTNETSVTPQGLLTLVDITARNITSFNCEFVRFVFEGDDIQDPTMSECGRFDIKPDYYGFELSQAGVWSRAIEGENTLLLDDKAFALMNGVGEFVGRVLLSEVAFDCEFDPDALPTDHLQETLAGAARTTSGMVEYAVPSLTADAIAKGFKLGLFEVIGNGMARITAKGKEVAFNATEISK
ncbi:hypothetical protein PVE_R2G0497 [Pseudomonas veronii 1YdBTEX2]|uniref:Uncharacterized protein n=1 Tax=Pseudomonas veronii 1YdBTEX2 TaxID=1295141 RepID=A0A1D3K830_PSEVE|nr:hypothetical protein PVE_R2G0497 [Pseudomonas veronii 1YdBTEX2]